MKIKPIDYRLETLKQIEEKLLQHADNHLYIWGCASTARTIDTFILSNSRIEAEAFIVDDRYYQDSVFSGKKVYKASEWREMAKKGDYVVMGFTGFQRAIQVMEELPGGVEGVYFDFPYSANAYGRCLSYDDYKRAESRFQAVYDQLEDDRSKDTMEAFLNACISGDMQKLNELKTDGQYFNELTKDCDVQYFVDCGAYIGDTIESALQFYEGRMKGIISFEPDAGNIQKLKERIAQYDLAHVELVLVPKGSWSGQTTLRFSSDNSSSSISEMGDIVIEADSVDNIAGSLDKPVGYLKMDVEGSEKETLLGAKNIIKRFHPLLAVCVYHRPEDLYELPETIRELSGEHPYHFYLRYHGPDLRELVLYAM